MYMEQHWAQEEQMEQHWALKGQQWDQVKNFSPIFDNQFSMIYGRSVVICVLVSSLAFL